MEVKGRKNKIFSVLPFLAVTVIFLCLLYIATYYDLQISGAIASLNGGKYYSDNVFGRIFEVIGECPLFIIVAIAFGFIFKALPQVFENKLPKFNRKSILITFKTVCVLFMVIVYTYCLKRAFENVSALVGSKLYEEKKLFVYIISVGVAMMLSAATLLLTDKVKSEKAMGIFVWAIIVILAAILSQGIVQILIKPFVGRMRFRAIYVLDENGLSDLARYTKWYVLNGRQSVTAEMIALGLDNDIFKSFPSGHVCAGTMIVTLAFIPEFLNLSEEKTKKWQIILWTVSAIYVIVLALSRIIMGAHYLSDVIVGAYITYVMAIISRKVVKMLVKKTKLL